MRARRGVSPDPRGRRAIAKLLLVVAPIFLLSGFLVYPFLLDGWRQRREEVPEYAMSSYVWVVAGPAGYLVCFVAVGLLLFAYAAWTLRRVGWTAQKEP